MSYRITIERMTDDKALDRTAIGVKIYEQVVDELDVPAVMLAVNRKPRKPRVRKEKEDK